MEEKKEPKTGDCKKRSLKLRLIKDSIRHKRLLTVDTVQKFQKDKTFSAGQLPKYCQFQKTRRMRAEPRIKGQGTPKPDLRLISKECHPTFSYSKLSDLRCTCDTVPYRQ